MTLSRDVRRPLYEIEGLISFYPHFRTEAAEEGRAARLPRPVLLAARRRRADRRSCGERYGADAEVELVEGSCIGRCDMAPGLHGERGTGSDGRRGRRYRDGPATAAARSRGTGAGQRPPHRLADVAAGRTIRTPPPADRYAVLRAVLAGDLATGDIIAALKDAGLRGMGGAGFPAGRKWDLVAAQEAAPKYVICNADESEPGTFKDREILATQPLPGARGHAARHARGRRRGRLGVHPARVRPGGAGDPRGDRVAARGRPDRPRRRRAPAGGCRSRCSPPPAATSSARSRR